MTPITFGSLFAGIGGFDLGFERAGMVCKWQVEIDDYATRVLEKHWPDVTRWRDVRTWPQPGTERVDVICGGFPCQDISYAGKGAGLAGERSGLFFDAMRCIGELGPRVIVLENVAALLTRGMGGVLGTLASFGFDAEWHCIPAASVGAPHLRDRVFLLGTNTQGDKRNAEPAIRSDGQNQSAPDYPGNSCVSKAVPNADRPRLEKRQGQDAIGTGQVCGSKPGGSEWWATEPAVGRVANGIPDRSHRLRGLGNAVVPQVAEWIGQQVVASLRGKA